MKTGKCDCCKEYCDILYFDKIKNKRGDYCEDCLQGYSDYIDGKIEDARMRDE